MRIAFLGPAGTYADEALRAHPPEEDFDAVPYPTIHDTVMAVQHREADMALAPIENSLEGGVAPTLDALAGDAGDVRIVGELVRTIRHCLIAREELELASITRVISHPQPLGQCARFLRERLPGAERAAAASTAEAVQAVVAVEEPWAALGSAFSAQLYKGKVLAEGIEDGPDNLTRFVWLGPEGYAALGEATKTSVVFWGFNDDSPGALVAVLSELADRGINLTRIESRPRRVRLGHYMFFADLDGAVGASPVDDALEALARRVETLRILGSYPAAGDAEGAR